MEFKTQQEYISWELCITFLSGKSSNEKIETIPKKLKNKFIMGKLNTYIEPQRRGIPKGEPIGLSKTKYWASLLMLTNIKQKEIARAVGVSYGLLRKWNTEAPFKKMVQRHCLDFALLFNEYIRKQRRKRVDKYLKRNWRKWLPMAKDILEVIKTLPKTWIIKC